MPIRTPCLFYYDGKSALEVDYDSGRDAGIVLGGAENARLQQIALKDAPADVRHDLGIDSAAQRKGKACVLKRA